MTYQEKDIRYENGAYWVLETPNAFEVYRVGVTHSTRCATIGKSLGLARAIAEVDRRETLPPRNPYS